MTSLRLLSLRNTRLLQDLPHLPTLEYIGISDSLLNRDVSAAWLLRSLSSIPNVRSIDITIAKREQPPADLQLQAVNLPRLKSLRLVCIDIFLSSIFEFLDSPGTVFPNTAAINLSFVHDTYSHPKTSGLISLFSRYRDHPATEFRFSVRIKDDDHGGNKISLMLKSDDTDCPLRLSAPILHDTLSAYIHLSSLLPTERIYSLHFLAPPKDQSIAYYWIDLCPSFPNLRELVLNGDGGIDFLRAYTERYLRRLEQESSPPNPQLSQLGFDKVNFEFGGEKTEAFEALVEALDEMKQAGLPMESISLARCSISKETVSGLTERITVVWDGREASAIES
ncbi:hypothetical protein ONZ45_g10231 [Pleurotus djamor]|nr:hypothetical protein ONZ45_g10231 [Pleurotus djamor]